MYDEQVSGSIKFVIYLFILFTQGQLFSNQCIFFARPVNAEIAVHKDRNIVFKFALSSGSDSNLLLIKAHNHLNMSIYVTNKTYNSQYKSGKI